MGVTRYDIIEEAFQADKLPFSELSILTGVDSSSYLIADGQQQLLRLHAHSHSPNEDWWSQDPHLQYSYLKTRLAWLGSRFTLIPGRLYNGNDRRSYLTELTNLDSDDIIMADAIPAFDLYLVYPIAQASLTQWRHSFVGCRFHHALSPILRQLAQQSSQLGLARMYAYIRDGYLIMVAIERNKLKFCNIFACPSAKDYLYHLLLAYEQCDWKAHKIPLRIFGEIIPDSEIYRLFYRYVRDIDFLSDDQLVNWGPKSQQQSTHLFYDLAALHSIDK